jgi:hypothetical protein
MDGGGGIYSNDNGEIETEIVRYGDLFYIPRNEKELSALKQAEVTRKVTSGSIYEINAVSFTGALTPWEIIHMRWGHPGDKSMDRDYPERLRGKNERKHWCKVCGLIKLQSLTFEDSVNVATRPGEEIHHDWQARKYRSLWGETGYEFVMDKYTHYAFAEPLVTEADSPQTVTKILDRSFTLHGHHTARLCGDNSAVNTCGEIKRRMLKGGGLFTLQIVGTKSKTVSLKPM